MRQHRIAVRVALLSGLALAIYLPALELHELKVAHEMSELRGEHPQVYLDRVRDTSGFGAYLTAYGELNGYGDWHARPPAFLEGGWRLYPDRQQVSAGYTPESCHPGIYFEPGELHLRGRQDRYPDALYRIAAGTIEAKLPGDGTLRLQPVAPGKHIYYLKIDGLPGTDGPRYAYRCG